MNEPVKERHLRVRPDRKRRAHALRSESPFPERLLWSRLRAGQLGGVRFRRQHAIGPYFADFYCARASLVVELDGYSHDETGARDATRTAYMEKQGLRVIRFSDDEVIGDIDDVVHRIACEIGLNP